MKKVYSVEEYIENNAHFSEALSLLRQIINSTELDETIKWSAPTYTLNGKNVVALGAFKAHFGIWFFNGVFLKDEHNCLTNAQEGKTKALRQMRFSSITDIDKHIVLSYVKEAINNQRLGKEVKPNRQKKILIIPSQLKQAFSDNSLFHDAFKVLTPGKQREYASYIEEAKRDATKFSRIEKIIPMVMDGIGLHDKYKNC